jgi:hypothetical protein
MCSGLRKGVVSDRSPGMRKGRVVGVGSGLGERMRVGGGSDLIAARLATRLPDQD